MKDNDKRLWVQTLWNPINEKRNSPLESEESGIRVVAYCRVSSKEDIQLKSLENQVSHYTHYIRSKSNWRFVGIYFDKGITGAASVKRHGFQRLIRHAEEGKIDYILTKSVSRFARNSTELIQIVEKLKENGVGVYFEKEKIDTSVDYNKFLLSTYAALAQEEIESMSNSIKWAHEKNMLRGKAMYSRLFGYEVVRDEKRSTIVIREEEAKVVRQIFHMYLEGHKRAEISRIMVNQGVKTSRGSIYWSTNRITQILRNVTYTGNKLKGDTRKDIFSSKMIKGYNDQILLSNSHDPIISMKVFNEVQHKLKNDIKGKKDIKINKQKPVNVLSKRVKCSRCGYSYSPLGSDNKVYLKCGNKRRCMCDSEILEEEKVKEMMINAMCLKYDFCERDIISKLKREIELINQNDNFEFHRLKAITEIEIANMIYSTSQSADDLNKIHRLELEYKQLEERIIKIEDDRKIRESLLMWIEKCKNGSTFIKNATVSILRAWITDIEVFSFEDYIVRWIDGSTTEMGDFREKRESYHLPNNKLRTSTMKSLSSNISSSNDKRSKPVAYHSDSIINDIQIQQSLESNKMEGNDLFNNEKKEIIRIEPGYKDLIMKNLNKNLDKKSISRNSSAQHSLGSKERLRTAAYCRISSETEEQKVSLKTQVAYYTYLILKDPKYEFAGIYADEGISGISRKNRTEFLKLLDDCKAGNVDLILTKSISRFSRNTLDCLDTLRMLKSLPNPVHIYFEKENIHTADGKSELMISVYGSIAQEESINMGEALAWGKRRYAERGIVNPSLVPYGYKKGENNEWEIEESEAMTVKTIYQMFIDGVSYNAIAKELTTKGIVSPGGKKHWVNNTIKYILTNEVYMGNYLYQKGYIKDCIKRITVKNNGELPQYLIEDRHDGIVSDELWYEAQNEVKRRTEFFEKRKTNVLGKDVLVNISFQKKFYCGHCGELCLHKRHVNKGKESHYWICKRLMKSNYAQKCDSKHFRQKYLEKHFMYFLLEIRNNPKFQSEVTNYLETLKLREEEVVKEREITVEIDKLNEELYKTVDTELNSKGQDSTIVDELTERIITLQALLKSFSDKRSKLAKLMDEYQWLNSILNTLDEELILSSKGLVNNEKIYFRNDVFERIVERGTVYKDGKISYSLSLGVEWTSGYNFEKFNKEKKEMREETRRKEHEELISSKEIRDMIEFCVEPKDVYQMHDFISSKIRISQTVLRKTVIPTLMVKGQIINVIPEKGITHKKKYYQKTSGKM